MALVLAISAGVGSLVVPARPADADPLSIAQARASALTTKIAAENQQLQDLTDLHDAASYRVSQLDGQIARSQARLAKDQAEVDHDESQLGTDAITDYVADGTSGQMASLFSGNGDAAGIRREYSSIALDNVTATVDQLHTTQARLRSGQEALRRQQAQATAAEHSALASMNRVTALEASDAASLVGIDAGIWKLILERQLADQAAARAAAEARLAVLQADSGMTGWSGSFDALGAPPPSSPDAAGAVQAAQREIGVRYTWGGSDPSTGFDCSGLIMWAYAQVGISLPHYSGAQYDDTVHIPLADIEPGDILFYGPGGDEHEAMYIGGGEMVEATHPGSTVMDDPIRTDDGFVGVGRVV